ncbi:MAG: hypothetical protein DME00_18840 [Candidatus Rokuibacteriota bacterium]|nr:MAG: hypothetical protein DME00_18840 [Candidatus Rokubacteria bacterium]
MNETRTLARFVADTTFTDLPRRLVENLKITVLDTFGAALVGTRQPWAQRIVAVAKALGGAAEASVLHHRWRTDVSRAALANGVLVGAFECEPLTGSHASGTVLPAALAISERERFDGVAFLTALALGFEVSARIARTAVGLETVRGFHNPGTQGPFGAAVAVGKLYGFDEARLTDALGIAGSSSAGLLEFAWSGGDTKRLHLGRAAQLGLESALLARQGVRGPATVLEGRSGYFNAFSTPPRLEKLVSRLGREWAIEPPSLKSYATHVTQQAVVQAIQDLKREHPLDPGAITRIAIRGAPRIMEERHAAREPRDVLGGQYSLPFTAAVACRVSRTDAVYRLNFSSASAHVIGSRHPAGDRRHRRGRRARPCDRHERSRREPGTRLRGGREPDGLSPEPGRDRTDLLLRRRCGGDRAAEDPGAR